MGFLYLGVGVCLVFSTLLVRFNLSAASICSPMNLITHSISVDLLVADFDHSNCRLEGNLINLAPRSPQKVFDLTPSVSKALMCDWRCVSENSLGLTLHFRPLPVVRVLACRSEHRLKHLFRTLFSARLWQFGSWHLSILDYGYHLILGLLCLGSS